VTTEVHVRKKHLMQKVCQGAKSNIYTETCYNINKTRN